MSYLHLASGRSYLLSMLLLSCLPVFTYADFTHTEKIYATENGLALNLDETIDELLDENNLLIVDLRINHHVLTDNLFVYGNAEYALIPLQSFFDAIEFPILVDVTDNSAKGWFIRTDQTFQLDLNRRQVTINEQTYTLNKHTRIINDGFDVYVDIKLLEQWFNLSLDLQLSKLRITLESEAKLPIQKQIEREKNRQKLSQSSDADWPIIKDQYRWAGWPTIDVSSSSGIYHRQNPTDRTADASYFVQGNADLLKMQHSFLISRPSVSDSPTTRFTLQRKQSHPDELLYSDVSHIAIGDIYAISDSLIFNSGTGLGIDIQFGQEKTFSDFGKKIIEGFAPPNWEIEVYRNNILIDFTIVGNDGRYRFDDLPLEYGENIFDVRLFGPQGQEETRREILNIGSNALPKGSYYARTHYSNLNQSVINNGPAIADLEKSIYDEQYGYLMYEYGISNKLSVSMLSAEHANPDKDTTNRNYLGGGFSYSLHGLALNALTISQLGAGSASTLSGQTRIANTSLSFSHKNFNSFNSQRSEDGNLKSNSELRINHVFSNNMRTPLSHQLIFSHQKNLTTQPSFKIENRFGFNALYGRINWNHHYQKKPTNNHFGDIRYLKATGVKLNIRSEIQYEIENKFKINSLNTTWTWYPEPNWNVQLASNSSFDTGKNSLGLSTSKRFDHLILSLNSSLVEGGGGFIGLSADFSLSRDDQHWRASPFKEANYGRVRVHTFLDQDGDQEYSPNDIPLEYVQFEGINRWRELETNAKGVSYLNHLRSSDTNRITLNQGSLSNPFWQSSFTNAKIVSHAGGLIDLSIPIQETIEIEGSIWLHASTEEEQRALAGVPVELTQNGEVVYETISEFDGYFVLQSILPGAYTLRLNAEALEKLKLSSPNHQQLNISGADGVIYLDKILLRRSIN